MQRLFSTFANGWPGIGLLLLRVLTCMALIGYGIASMIEAPPLTIIVLQIIGAGAGILLLIGLWTPVAGVLAAIVNVWIGFSRIFRLLEIHGLPSYRRSSAPFWRWSGPAHGPSMPGSSAGNASICRSSNHGSS